MEHIIKVLLSFFFLLGGSCFSRRNGCVTRRGKFQKSSMVCPDFLDGRMENFESMGVFLVFFGIKPLSEGEQSRYGKIGFATEKSIMSLTLSQRWQGKESTTVFPTVGMKMESYLKLKYCT